MTTLQLAVKFGRSLTPKLADFVNLVHFLSAEHSGVTGEMKETGA